MSQKNKKTEIIEQTARKLFGGVNQEDLPSVDILLRALELAKGSKFILSPNAVKIFMDHVKKQGISDPAGKFDFCSWPINDYQCNPCDWKDVCLLCDFADVCIQCDALDCNPGFGPDIEDPAIPKP